MPPFKKPSPLRINRQPNASELRYKVLLSPHTIKNDGVEVVDHRHKKFPETFYQRTKAFTPEKTQPHDVRCGSKRKPQPDW
ncbi:hypothetical protein RMSM_00969 [Rhodopirellula maiorica SM1]|uniref:Uncharacterized protein n=1 Tax=Rhodopirellula maiorica SM1 TaxID=1265738 RepID=M5S380_9BACT|nr:hypothetical protein RMSM_00969 [Rhodopirellula maiorica SM1]